MTPLTIANAPEDVWKTLEGGFQPAKYANDIFFWGLILVAVIGAILFVDYLRSKHNEGSVIEGMVQ